MWLASGSIFHLLVYSIGSGEGYGINVIKAGAARHSGLYTQTPTVPLKSDIHVQTADLHFHHLIPKALRNGLLMPHLPCYFRVQNMFDRKSPLTLRADCCVYHKGDTWIHAFPF